MCLSGSSWTSSSGTQNEHTNAVREGLHIKEIIHPEGDEKQEMIIYQEHVLKKFFEIIQNLSVCKYIYTRYVVCVCVAALKCSLPFSQSH